MKVSLKKQIKQFDRNKQAILDFIFKKGYSTGKVGEYSATTGVPLYVVYYYCWKDLAIEDAEDHMRRLMEFYNVEDDLCE